MQRRAPRGLLSVGCWWPWRRGRSCSLMSVPPAPLAPSRHCMLCSPPQCPPFAWPSQSLRGGRLSESRHSTRQWSVALAKPASPNPPHPIRRPVVIWIVTLPCCCCSSVLLGLPHSWLFCALLPLHPTPAIMPLSTLTGWCCCILSCIAGDVPQQASYAPNTPFGVYVVSHVFCFAAMASTKTFLLASTAKFWQLPLQHKKNAGYLPLQQNKLIYSKSTICTVGPYAPFICNPPSLGTRRQQELCSQFDSSPPASPKTVGVVQPF